MSWLDRIAAASLAGDALSARSLVQEWLQTRPTISDEPPPAPTADVEQASLAAALAELFAGRLGQRPPAWAATVGGVSRPIFLVRAAERMPRLRGRCQAESPPPLRRRQFYAPANYLEAV